jgi:Tfp pilus assembly protein PilV
MAIQCLSMAHLSKRRRGGSYIEILVTILILGVSLVAALNLFSFSFLMTEKTADEGIAYNLLRKSVESVRNLGFSYVFLPDGTVTTYYNSTGGDLSNVQNAGHKFKVIRTVTSDKYTTTPTGPRPSADSMRTVRVQVQKLPTNELVCETATMVVRSGL